jgi:DNA-directed RNA polymerase beta subunit
LTPTINLPHITEVKNDDLKSSDLMAMISATINQFGLADHNLHGFNLLMTEGIKSILMRNFDISRTIKNERTQTKEDKNITAITININFTNVDIAKPMTSTFAVGKMSNLLPHEARKRKCNYMGDITVDATVSLVAKFENGGTETKTANITNTKIGSFPIMVGSNKCHTHGISTQERMRIHEDPMDVGGYFITRAGEYCVDLLDKSIN